MWDGDGAQAVMLLVSGMSEGGSPKGSGHRQRIALIDLFCFSQKPVWPEPPSIVAARTEMAARLCLLTVALGLGLFAIDRLKGVPADADSLLTLVLAGMGAASWVLLKRRHYSIVAWLLVVLLFGMATVSTWFYGSVRTIDIALILVGQVAVGIFLSHRALVWITAGAIVLLGALTWADAAGLLLAKPQFAVGWRTWVSQSACLAGVAAMMYLNRTQMRMAQELHLLEARQRLRAQLDRDLEQERFTRVFQSSSTPIFVQSARTGVIIDLNPAFERTTGYPRKEVLGKRDGFLWLRDEHRASFVRERRAARRTGWLPITGMCRNGRQLDLRICSERDDDPDDGLVITAMRVLGNATGGLPTALAPLGDGPSEIPPRL